MADVDRLYDLMKDGFDGVHSRLDELNGRTRTNERDIAVLQDRGVRSKDTTARWGAFGLGALGIFETVVRHWLGGGK